MQDLPEYRYRGARALVILHEQHLREFLATWRRAQAAGVALPRSSDPNYRSLATLLSHVLRCARSYLLWICRQLDLPDPGVRPAPAADTADADADEYLEHVLERWRAPLAEVPEARFYRPEYPSNWGVAYCIDAMLEHAVMHPLRHRFQLAGLLADP